MFKGKQLHMKIALLLCAFPHYDLLKSDMTFQLKAILRYLGESEMLLFNLVLFPHLGCWDGNGNGAHAAGASSLVLHRA